MRRLGRFILPRSLYGQILLVVALGLLAAQVVNAALLLAGARNRAIVETSTMIVSRVANQIERQQAMGIPIGEADWLNRQKRDGSERQRRRPPPVSISVAPVRIDISREDYQSEISGRAREFLRQGDISLGDVRISTVSVNLLPPQLRDPQLKRWRKARLNGPDRPEPKNAVLFTARLPDGKWIIAAGLVRPTENASIFAMLLQTVLLFIAVLLPLAWVVRRVSRPLEQLTGRVQRVGLANEIGPLESRGPADVRQLIEAFNAMQSRVSTLLGEKDVMLGAIGHDLKTPLAALRVRIESVDDDSERDKMAATIDEMATILDDILTLARLGKSGEASQRTDIGALVGSIAEEYPDAALSEPDQRIVADVRPVLLRRALRNLIGNAITYGKSAAISVKQDRGQLRIVIEDEGPGIAPDLIDSMFEPFARAETSRSRATGGSGLGLTIARAIARAHDGDVVLENRAEGGLRVSLILPA